MTLINSKISLNLSLPENCATSSAVGKIEFAITDTSFYVPVITLSTEDNIKLLKQLESRFKRTINWNKYQSKLAQKIQNRYLDILINPNLDRVNRLFVLLFQSKDDRNVRTRFFRPKVEIKDYNVVIHGKHFFGQPIKNDKISNNNIQNISAGQGGDCTNGFLLVYIYFKEHYKLISIDLSKQLKLAADPKALQQNNFTANLQRDGNPQIFFIMEEAKETVSDFSKGAIKVL